MPAGIIERLSVYKLPLILGGSSCFVIALSLILLVKSTQSTKPIEFSNVDKEASGSALGAASIMVDVEGAVIRPGLYSFAAGARVEDAILAAGGLAKDVDDTLFAKNINRASKLVDGGKIFIPSLSSPQSPQLPQAPLSSLISVNSATESQLDSLPGIGPATAAKIINNRPYQTLEELVTKKAIGTSLYEKLKNNLSL